MTIHASGRPAGYPTGIRGTVPHGALPAAAAAEATTVLGPAPTSPATATAVDSTANGGRSVALTFDDGPDPRDTRELLAVLRKHQVRAVFCLWGDHVEAHPEVVREIVRDGHELAGHSMHHDDMSDWEPERIRADLQQTNNAIAQVVPGVPVHWFRAPFGSWGRTPEVAASLGMQPLGWRLAVGDWDPPGTDELVRRVKEGVTPGAVVLLHDGGGDRSQTVAAVDRIIPELRAGGWHFDQPARRA
ncbi:polysaccharide deacetylase family protein [Peterkaempfera sp. SMS 1(5)a]|uniref:polysaccharide deacetylase family protein n=1 Tax=Peterkaempfera podocarpi TaxID=3232308 RepID=UPI00366E884E